ncbi:hypothetical protein [uncultured Eubacterium sp.]|uniref:hypothetical protein n=1 Tax=uncultured Eubacterium sp. TaxID=165185 RepID=UPI002670DB79|nr:hypothetical protein [uncultured Eubacterium sp.]
MNYYKKRGKLILLAIAIALVGTNVETSLNVFKTTTVMAKQKANAKKGKKTNKNNSTVQKSNKQKNTSKKESTKENSKSKKSITKSKDNTKNKSKKTKVKNKSQKTKRKKKKNKKKTKKSKSKYKTLKETQITTIKQNIEVIGENNSQQFKEYIVGCRHRECKIHEKNKISDEGCKYGSDLFNIQIKEYSASGKFEDNKGFYEYKSIYDCGFKTIQGATISNNIIYIAFTDKGTKTKEKKDLTVIVGINLEKNNVVCAYKGTETKNIYGLGHANDLFVKGTIIHSAWYLSHEGKKKKNYDYRMGYMDLNYMESQSGENIQTRKKYKEGKKYVFGTSCYEKNRIALGVKNKGGKDQIVTYKFTGSSYENEQILFNIQKNTDYKTLQCMEFYKKFYIVRFYEKPKGNNNCVEIYNKKGKRIKCIVIRDPIYNEGKKEAAIDYRWEVESLCHYKGDWFYYVNYKPSTKKNKKAYLYKVKIK